MDIVPFLDREKIDKLFRAKIEHGQLFLFRFQGISAVFRPLTTAETETIIKLAAHVHEVAIEDWVIKTTYITGSKDIDFILDKVGFGYHNYISTKIGLLSVAQEEKEYKDTIVKERENVNTAQNVVEILIAKAYKGYSPQDIKNMTQSKQLEVLAKAEIISGEQIDLGNRKKNKQVLRKFSEGATVIGGDITSPEVADKPEF